MEYEIAPDEALSVAAVTAVSSVENCPITSLPPLNESIDPDALDKLFASRGEGATGRLDEVSFRFSDSLVTVDNDERLRVEPISECKTP